MYLTITCPRCKGSGEEPANKFAAVATLGISLFIEHTVQLDCSRCQGAGRVYATRDDLRRHR